MARNKLTDVTNILFGQLEKITEDDFNTSQLENEIKKTKMITNLSNSIIEIASIKAKAIKLKSEYLRSDEELPSLLKEDS